MSEQDSPLVTETVVNIRPQLGEVLAAQRELKKMTVSEVASQLRLAVRQIDALEANDFSKLPEPMITRGFIRNYARLLGVGAEPLIQAHRALSGEEQPHSLNISSENISIANHHAMSWLKILPIVFIVLLIVFGLSYYAKHPFSNFSQPAESVAQNSTPPEASPSESSNAAVVPVEEKLPEPALPIAERMSEGDLLAASTQLPTVDATTTVQSEAQATPNDATIKADAVKEKQLPEVASTIPQLAFELSFTEQSWVSVVDGDNKEIFSKLSAAGSSEKIVGKPPLKLHIGNAAGTQVNYKGKLVDLGQYTRNNIARITLSLEKN